MGGRKRIDLTQRVFGRLTVVSILPYRSPTKAVLWNCVCTCGNNVIVPTGSLCSDRTNSCGCFRKEHIRQVGQLKTHGATIEKNLPLYNVWQGIKQRCNNPNSIRYKDYGGRGIKLFSEWNKSFEKFRDYVISLDGFPTEVMTIDGVSEKTLDRIRNEEGYKPGNIKWSTAKEQQNNKRSNRIIKVKGYGDMTLEQVIEKFSRVSSVNVRNRLAKGWGIKETLLQPINRSMSRK